MFKNLVLLGAGLLVSGQAAAAIIAQDDFTYDDGPLAGNGSAADAGWSQGWRAINSSNNTTVTSGVVSGISGTRIARNLSSALGADETSVFIGIDHEFGTFFSGIEFNNGGDQDKTNRNFVFGVGDGGVGYTDKDETFIAASSTGLNRYVIEITYGIGDQDTATLYKNGVSLGTTAGNERDLSFDRVLVASFGRGTTLGPTDNLIIATTFAEAVPEPGSLALLGLGGLCMLRRRRG